MAAGKRVAHRPFKAPPDWLIYKRQPGIVLGFHGCDRSTAERILSGQDAHLNPSKNDYDWLGSGVYFWESDPWRAMAFAEECRDHAHLTSGSIDQPYVIGAAIEPGLCFNLLEINALNELKDAHAYLETVSKIPPGHPMPANKGAQMGQRFLDKAVVEAVHKFRAARKMQAYDSVRSSFIEGDPVYNGSGFKMKNHIQIAIRELSCIKGYFRLSGL